MVIRSAEGIKMRSPRVIHLNGLDVHLLHVFCCHFCAAVKCFMSKVDGTLSKSFIIIIIIILFVAAAAAAAVVVLKSSVYFILS